MFLHTVIYNHTSAIVMSWCYRPAYVSLYGHKDVKPCSDHCHEITTTSTACLISGLRKTMLRPLLWRGQQPPHVSLYGHIKPCSDHCQEMRTIGAACFFIRPYKTMLRPLPWDYDNARRMFDIGDLYNHAQTIVIVWGQQPPHVSL